MSHNSPTHYAINWFAVYYIKDPKARDTQLDAMRNHHSWRYKGDLERETVAQHYKSVKEAYNKCERLAGHTQLDDVRCNELLLSIFDNGAQLHFVASDPNRLLNPGDPMLLIQCMNMFYLWKIERKTEQKTREEANKEKKQKKKQEERSNHYSNRGRGFGRGSARLFGGGDRGDVRRFGA